MPARVLAFVRDESGATAIEYGLLLATVTLIVVGIWRHMGDSLSSLFNTVSGVVSASVSAAS